VAGVGEADQLAEADGDAGVVGQRDVQTLGIEAQQLVDARVQLVPVAQHPLGEAEPHHRKAPPPVPPRMHRQPLKQRPAAREQLGQGVHEQGLAEAARARQEVILALLA
jgi:hypothetical protein